MNAMRIEARAAAKEVAGLKESIPNVGGLGCTKLWAAVTFKNMMYRKE
jgi:hypothetical protein